MAENLLSEMISVLILAKSVTPNKTLSLRLVKNKSIFKISYLKNWMGFAKVDPGIRTDVHQY